MGLSNFQMGLVVSWPSILMHVIVVLFCLCSGFGYNIVATSSVHGGNETDLLALFAFRAKVTDDPSKALSSWNESIHFCRWLGVTCGRRHQRVIAMNLAHRQLTGSISPHVGNMSFLRVLSLLNNSFTHMIPPEIGRLRRLRYLWLNNNSITGEIPTNISGWGNNLISLTLYYNKLEGRIPSEIGSLSKLEEMKIYTNNLIGPLPPSLGNLSSSLREFSAAENHISESIPDALGQLTNLERLGLGANRLFGTIPPSIFNLSSITVLDVGHNQIQGSLPSDLGNTLSGLQFLSITENLFTGSIPISISNASNLEILQLGLNELTGKMPSLEKLHKLRSLYAPENQLGYEEADGLSFLCSFTNASYLRILNVYDNNFGGVLPKCIGNFSTNLFLLSLSNDKLFGSIPTEIVNLVNLEMLFLDINQFTGTIPANIGKFSKLQYLSLASNKFSGNIPLSLGNLSLLTELNAEENQFLGSVPPSLGKCQNLAKISLSQNNLEGTIPPQIFISISTLWSLNLSGNRLTGSFPMEVGNLKNIEELDVSNNNLSGEIPSTFGSCVKLALLVMAGNNFHGILPSSLSYLRGIQGLDLSRNNLSGKIPSFLEGFVLLQYLNLSFNDFEGEVPKLGAFKNATEVSLSGNNKLCGGIPELQLPSCKSQGSKKNRSSLTVKLIAPLVAFGIVGLILVLCFWVRPWCRKTGEVPSLKILGNPFLKVSYRSLLKATDGFSPAHLIGVGSFGSVYKGTFGGKTIAVKVLNLQFHVAFKSFKAECEALRSIKHRNLVKVLTACSSIDYQGNDFKALVFEFMVNGSLEKWLHPDEYEGEAHRESSNLNLLQRLNVTIDVASALDYLHHHCPKPIAHCDLKPSNVLLDDEMTAHVGDFGLAKFLPQATYDSVANQSSSIGMRGSVGYAAPEYGMGNEVSTSGDVYSYGILLLEMFTGKRPTDNMFSDGLNLHNFVKMASPEQVERIADPKMFQQREEGEGSSSINITGNQSSADSHKIEECLISIFRVGIGCSEELPRDRMDIKDVLTQLHGIKKKFGTGQAHGGRGATTTIRP